jgi:N-acetylmuramoyl-L-alanine amidase
MRIKALSLAVLTTSSLILLALSTQTSAQTGARAPQKPKLTVVIDPGHGGMDPGMVGYVVEKETTLDVSLKVRNILQSQGIRIFMTRMGDYTWQGRNGCDKACDLDKRSDMGSTEKNAFVSIHVNSASPRAQGIETYVFGESLDAKTLAQAERENGGGDVGRTLTRQARNKARELLNNQLAQLNIRFSKRLAEAVQARVIQSTNAVNLGVKTSPFWVIRYPRIPAVLIEIGFGTHPTEGKNLATQHYRQRIAQGIAQGILSFLSQK